MKVDLNKKLEKTYKGRFKQVARIGKYRIEDLPGVLQLQLSEDTPTKEYPHCRTMRTACRYETLRQRLEALRKLEQEMFDRLKEDRDDASNNVEVLAKSEFWKITFESQSVRLYAKDQDGRWTRYNHVHLIADEDPFDYARHLVVNTEMQLRQKNILTMQLNEKEADQ